MYISGLIALGILSFYLDYKTKFMNDKKQI